MANIKTKQVKMEFNKNSIIIGCNYHTTWQKYSGMRFVLTDVKDNKAKLMTRTTKKNFWTDLKDLIFIMSDHNISKANRLIDKPKNKQFKNK